MSSHASTAWLAARLFAIDPSVVGGIVVHAAAGPVRDRWLADLRATLAPGTPWRPVPLHAGEDRLLGGIELAATLQSGRPVAQRGLLAASDGGVVVLAMAERAPALTISHIATALDRHEVVCMRDGVDLRDPARFAVLALDESAEEDAPVSDTLRDRCALHVDLSEIAWRELEGLRAETDRSGLAAARARYPAVTASDSTVEALCAAALALGVTSIRACLFTVRVARLAAAAAGRLTVSEADATIAAQLVLGPRARNLPAATALGEEDSTPGPESSERPDDPPASAPNGNEDAPLGLVDDPPSQPGSTGEALEDRVLAAAAAAIPSGLLSRLSLLDAGGTARLAPGRAGALQRGRDRGRPAGVAHERPRGGARLDVIATLRAAVPWQRVRGREEASAGGGDASSIRIRGEDFHVRRFKQRGRTTTVFAVDASGSSALHRLAEAKGAVELLLADCYVRRDSVAVIGFRGASAQLLLPPTRSLVRAKRSLAELPGGGGTPMASGLDAARELALALRRRGETPVVVVLSDGRANVARDGSPGRPRAEAEARGAARSIRDAGVAALFIDTSPHPHPLARELAGAMNARYLPLPHAEATSLSAAVRSASAQDERRR